MANGSRFLVKRMRLLMVALLVLPLFSMPAQASVVSGEFIYVQEGDGSFVQYHVNAVDYKGIPAWRVAWDCEQIKAEHYLRQSDGSPLYVKRINHSQKRTVEITYSLNEKEPTVYRKRSENEYIERKIWDTGLRDLGALPQLLLGFAKPDSREDVSFSAINYEDGKVYPLIAEQSGYRTVSLEGERVRCAIYDVKLDSWMATFIGTTRLLIPLPDEQNSNFVSYNGPGLDGVADAWSLKLLGKGSSLAMAKEGLLTQ
ncbi:MAG: hypothetical protein ACE5E3_03755 [Mariprofundus sp.]